MKKRRRSKPAERPALQWTDPIELATVFANETRRGPTALRVLALVLPHHWGDIVAAGSWLTRASQNVYIDYVPGYSHARTYTLIERFVTWLHERGYLDEWQLRVLASRMDDAREAHGLPRTRSERTIEMSVEDHRGLGKEFGRTLEDPFYRRLAPRLVHCLVGQVLDDIGPCCKIPLGSLDADAFVALVFGQHSPRDRAADRDLLMLSSRFYRWLGETGRLDPDRASAIASRLAAGALALVA